MIRYGKIKNIGSGRVDIQLTGSSGVTRNVRVSSQVNWNTLRLNDTVLVETIDGLPVVLHTIADTPLVYETTERTYAGVGSNSGSSTVQNALLADGSVPLTGNMNVTPGVTIDGYDISTLGDAIGNLQAADSIARTGYTVMSHASHLVETISSSDTSILIRHGIFVDTESLSVSNVGGEIEVMKVVGAGVPTVDDNGVPCYRYTVQRRISTNPSGIVVGWAASTIVSGLTLRGYISFDNRAGREGTPSMRFVMHTDIPNNQTEHIGRMGNLRGVLGYTDLDYGFAVGKLTSATKFLAYNSTTDDLRLRGADLQLDNESGELSFRLWGVPESGRSTGDVSAGPQSSGHIEWMGAAKRLGIFSANAEIIYFDEIGGHFAGMITAGEELGPNIGIGVLNGEGTIVARNRDAMAQFVLQTRSTGDRGVYMFAGNPKPEGGWLELDRTLTYDGTIRARDIQLLGGMAFGQEGLTEGAVPEIVIQDPLDVRRMGIIRPAYMGGYSVNGMDQQYLSMLLSWGGANLEPIPGSGTFVEWKQGEAFWGDWNGNHFRVEKDGRIGHFFGSTPKAWSDNLGNFNVTGTITALAGSIGGWTIGASALTSSSGAVALYGSGIVTWADGKGILDSRGITIDQGGDTAMSTPYGGIGSSQNYIPFPNDFQSKWNYDCAISVGQLGPTEVADASEAVFTGTQHINYDAVVSGGVADPYVFSVWLRSATPVNVTLTITPTMSDTNSVVVTTSSTWKRYSVNCFTSALPYTCFVDITATSSTIQLWGAQLEKTDYSRTLPTIYSPTLSTSRIHGPIWLNPTLVWENQKIDSSGVYFYALVGQKWKPLSDSTTGLLLANAAGTAKVTVDTTNGRLGIGNTPAYALDVSGTTTIRLPVSGTDAYLTLTSATATAFNTRLGTTASNQYGWYTNLYYTGSAWGKDDATRGAWNMSQIVTTTDAGSSWSLAYFPVGNTTGITSIQAIGTATGANFCVRVGLLGINTASPTSNIHSVSAAGVDNRLTLVQTSNGTWTIGIPASTDRLDFSTGTDLTLPKVSISSSGYLSIGTTSAVSLFHSNVLDANTGSVITAATFSHDLTSGTAGTGMGVGIAFRLKSTTTNRQSSRIVSLWSDPNDSSYASDLVFFVSDYATEREMIRLRANGTAASMSFWASTPATKQTLNTYTSDVESTAYIGMDNAQPSDVYANVDDLNYLRDAYENLRAMVEDLRTKLQTTTLVG